MSADLNDLAQLRAENTRLRRALAMVASPQDPDLGRTLLDTIAHLVVVLDREGRMVRFNRACETLTGWSENEVLRRPLWDFLIAPEDLAETQAVFADLAAGHFPNRHENDWLTRNGERRRIAWSNSALVDEQGVVSYVIATGLDITDEHRLRRVEDALRESELRFRAVFDNTFQFVGLFDSAGTLIDINQTALALVGTQAEQVLGRPAWETPWWNHSIDEMTRLREAISCAATGLFVRYTFVLPTDDDSRCFIDFSLRPLRDPAGSVRFLIAEGRDITDLRRLDETLRESERRYRLLFENLTAGFALHEILCDPAGRPIDYRFLEVNPAYERLTGLSAKTLIGHTVREAIPRIETHWISTFGQVALTGEPVELEDHVAGRWFEVRAFCPSRGHFAVVLNEITARRRAEQALHAREEDLAITLRSIGDAVIATNAAGQLTRLNHAAERLTGWTADQALGRPLTEVFRIINAHTRQTIEDPVVKVLRSGSAVELAINTVLVARDGRERQIADSAAPIRDDAGLIRGVVLVFRDVTEQSHLEEQLRQSQKMETIGRLAGGVAHDFNNLLTGILGYSELLSMRLRGDEHSRSQIDVIREAAERGADLARQLLVFSRKGNRTSVVSDLHRLLKNIVGILQRTCDKRITVTPRLEAVATQVTGDPALLQSAFLNLAVNARDAMPEGGTLTLTSANVVIDRPLQLNHAQVLTPGHYLRVAVIDTGSGMAPDVLEHLYEPFFTTKSLGVGNGLGLAAVYGTISEHRGGITVASAVGSGTSFTIYLPLTEQVPPSLARTVVPVNGQGRILLVDDEPLLRRLGAEQLTSLGYEVVLAADGQEALEIFSKDPTRITAVVLDVIMPRRNGPDTFRAMRARDPQVKVLMISGYGADIDALLQEGVLGFIQKPFNAAELSQALAAAIVGTNRTSAPQA